MKLIRVTIGSKFWVQSSEFKVQSSKSPRLHGYTVTQLHGVKFFLKKSN